MTPTQRTLNRLLSLALTDAPADGALPTAEAWETLRTEVRRHSVWPMLYELFREQQLPPPVRTELDTMARNAARQSYHLMMLARCLITRMEAEGIPVALLKGGATARHFTVPEMRKSGDVDLLLLDQSRLADAVRILREAGLNSVEEQHANHHQEWLTGENLLVELHVDLIEEFDNTKANQTIRRQVGDIPLPLPRADVLGAELPVLPEPFEAYHLLLHMLQHFLRKGFGVRLLCDWVVFWNRPVPQEEVTAFLKLVSDCGLSGFLRMVTSACVNELGLRGNRGGVWRDGDTLRYAGGVFCTLADEKECEPFWTEVYAGGEFGSQEEGRMVMVRGHGPGAYVREFHHQMRLNHPKASKCPLLWPALWVITLAVFLINNHRLNRGSWLNILKNAGERSKINEKMRLFEE